MPNEKTAKFNLLKKANEVKDDKGNVIICTRQEIVQSSGSSSEHIVVSKVRRNVDGTQQGVPKSLFLPIALIPEIIKAVESLKK